jgi:hypothetical protein
VRRRLVAFVSAASLLLFAAVCALWVRSYWVSDAVEWRRVTRDERTVYSWYLLLSSGRGGVGFSRDAEDNDARYATVRDVGSRWSFTGWRTAVPTYPQPVFHSGARVPAPGIAARWAGPFRRELILPYWSLAVVFALLPAVQLRRRLRHRKEQLRRQAGRCPACGYDLRESPDRCPECGRSVEMTT